MYFFYIKISKSSRSTNETRIYLIVHAIKATTFCSFFVLQFTKTAEQGAYLARQWKGSQERAQELYE